MAAGVRSWLLVEDTEFLALTHCRLLKAILPPQYQITCVKHGDQALRAIRGEAFEAWELDEESKRLISMEKVQQVWDGYILDCNMPISEGRMEDAGILIAKEIHKMFDEKFPIFSCSYQSRQEFSDRNLFNEELDKRLFRKEILTQFQRLYPQDFPDISTPR